MRLFFIALCVCLWPWAAYPADTPNYRPAPDWVVDTAIPKSSPEATGPTELLLQDVQIKFDELGRHLYTRTVVAIRTDAGLNALGNLGFSWNPVLEDLTLHRVAIRRDGKILDLLDGGKSVAVLRREENLDQAKLDGALTASLQPAGLQVGDILEIASSTTRLDPIFQGKGEIGSGFLMANATGRLRVTASWPPQRAFRWRAAPGLPAVKPFSTAKTAGIRIEADNLQPLPLPESAPNRFYDVGAFEISEFADFGAISALLFPVFTKASRLQPDPDLDAAIDKIRSENASATARVIAALRLVQEKIRYIYIGIGEGGYVPADANLTWKRRFGDCKGKTVLLIGILEKLGVPAEAALVQTVFGDGLEKRLPLLQAFDHVLVRVKLDGNIHWIDPTRYGDRDLAPNAGSNHKWALPLRDGGAELERLPEFLPKDPIVSSEIRMDATQGITLPVKLDVRTTIRGDAAVSLHLEHDNLSAAQREEFLKAYWKTRYTWDSIDEVGFRFDDSKREVVLSAKGALKLQLYAGKNGGKQFPLSGGDLGWKLDLERPAGPNQDTPYKIAHPDYAVVSQSIALPYGGFGYSMEAEAITQTIGPWRFERRTSLSDGVARVETITRSLDDEIPAAQAKAVSTQVSALAKKRAIVQLEANLQGTPAEITALKASAPEDEDALLDRALTLTRVGDYKGAIADYNAILAKNPISVWALANRAIAFVETNDYANAENDITKALAIDPENWVANNAAGNLAYRKREYTKAVEYFSKSSRASPKESYAILARAKTYIRMKNYSGATGDLSELHRQSPDNPSYLISLASALAKDGQADKALALMDKFVDSSKEDSSAHENAIMARVLVAIAGKANDRAKNEANALLATEPRSVPLLVFHCQVYTALGEQLQAGLRSCDEAVRLDPQYPEALTARATAYLKLKSPKQAQRDFQTALRLDPKSPIARSGLGITKVMQRNPEGFGDFLIAQLANPDIDLYWESYGINEITSPPSAP